MVALMGSSEDCSCITLPLPSIPHDAREGGGRAKKIKVGYSFEAISGVSRFGADATTPIHRRVRRAKHESV